MGGIVRDAGLTIEEFERLLQRCALPRITRQFASCPRNASPGRRTRLESAMLRASRVDLSTKRDRFDTVLAAWRKAIVSDAEPLSPPGSVRTPSSSPPSIATPPATPISYRPAPRTRRSPSCVVHTAPIAPSHETHGRHSIASNRHPLPAARRYYPMRRCC